MDAAFGAVNYWNEIVWKRTSGRKASYQFGRVHDVILFYTRSSNATWTAPSVPQTAATLRGHDVLRAPDGKVYRLTDLTAAEVRNGDTGEPWRGLNVTAKGRHWAYYREELDRLDQAGRVHWPKGAGMPRLKVPVEDLPGRGMVECVD